jgi:hypothetical protein
MSYEKKRAAFVLAVYLLLSLAAPSASCAATDAATVQQTIQALVLWSVMKTQ